MTVRRRVMIVRRGVIEFDLLIFRQMQRKKWKNLSLLLSLLDNRKSNDHSQNKRKKISNSSKSKTSKRKP
jgi:hypothetical protein